MAKQFLFFFLLWVSLQAAAQERLYSLEYNGTLLHRKGSAGMDSPAGKYDTVLLTLPFYDDFSKISVWPSPLKWADNQAFINTDYARNAPTVGVATLDAIDESGALHTGAGSYPFDADKLTSQPIRLDSVFSPERRAIRRSDSLYLSFYYQPQGRGSMPAKSDSLIVEFHSPAEFDTIVTASGTTLEPVWHTVWSTGGGTTVDTFALYIHNIWFRQVMIPVTDSSRYFRNGFRFRFRNIASLANNYVPDWQSNGDQWNIDVVRLGTGRSLYDTAVNDLAFADRAPSLLDTYESMPYHQYSDNFINEMKDTVNLLIANLDRSAQNINYGFNVRMDSRDPFYVYDGGSYSILPFLQYGYLDWQPMSSPALNIFYPPGTPQSTVFHSIHILTTDPSLVYKQNDTIQYTQVFSNYYAYDDGTAEAGVGLNGAAGSYAVRFALNKPDTLRGIQVYFNQTRNGAADQYFDLKVWNDAFGKPGEEKKVLAELTPIYTDSLNKYQTYWFEEPLLMDAESFPGLIFYAGWSQSGIDNLNVGLDRYNDSHTERYYNVDGNWIQSDAMHAGSVMIRPVVGAKNPLGIETRKNELKLAVTPNPVIDGRVFVYLPKTWESKTPGSLTVRIFSIPGSLVRDVQFTNPLSVSGLTPGLYLIQIADPATGESLSAKIIVRN